MSGSRVAWLGVAVLTLMTTTGCEIITETNRDDINQGSGGGATTSSSSSSGAMVECTEDAQCEPTGNECTLAVCNSGKCETANVAAGTPAGDNVAGDCQISACDGQGNVKTDPDDMDLPVDGFECTDDVCTDGVASNPPVGSGIACGANMDLFCDGNGACVGCLADADCGTATDCSTPVCNAMSECETQFTAPGTPITNQTPGDCQIEQCDGIGGTKTETDTTDILDDGNECTIDSCDGSMPMSTNAPSGTMCTMGGSVCDGAGTCIDCLTNADCASLNCVNQICIAATCDDTIKNQGESDVDCGGANCDTCPNGDTCTTGTDCTSTVCSPMGVCVDSVCGDGRVTGAEGCDDSANMDGDGCSATCTVETGWACTGEPSMCVNLCGNGLLDDPSEECDDNNSAGNDGCSATCKREPGYTCTGQPSMCVFSCGNGVLDAGEGCDDGNAVGGDGCSNVCATETGYQCAGAPSTCTPVCGDGMKLAGEYCDDGNTDAGDCCSDTCGQEAGCETEANNDQMTADLYTGPEFVSNRVKGFIDPNTDNDYFVVTVPAGAMGTITAESMTGPLGSTCGNQADSVDTNVAILDSMGVILDENDDISTSNYCSYASATNLAPGDYYIRVTNSPFVPDATFDYTLEVLLDTGGCGDGTIGGVEDCDDGNSSDGDGCSSACVVEPGYICTGTPSVCVQPESQCSDGIDNDGDGNIDGADSDCALPAYVPACPAGSALHVFHSTDGSMQIPYYDPNQDFAVSAIPVTGTSAGVVTQASIVFNVTHPWVADLANIVVSPANTQVIGVNQNGGSGDNFTNTALSDACPTSITTVTSSAAPFSACYSPNGTFTDFVNESADGYWLLGTTDLYAASDDGTADNWSLALCIGAASVCGDGTIGAGEACDDNNTTDGDGCSSTCEIEPGYTCTGAPSVCYSPETICNDGIDNNGDGNTDSADANCQLPAYFPGCGSGETLHVYRSSDTPAVIPDNGTDSLDSFITVGSIGNIASGGLLLNIAHAYDADIEARLISPSNTSFDMTIGNGGSGDNYVNTILHPACFATPVSGGTPPFTGCYSPDGDVTPLLGTPASGMWTLNVFDNFAQDQGTLQNWAFVLCTQ